MSRAAIAALRAIVTGRAAVERLRLWENGKRLRLRFLDGDPVVQEKIANIATEWEQFTNLELDSQGCHGLLLSIPRCSIHYLYKVMNT